MLTSPRASPIRPTTARVRPVEEAHSLVAGILRAGADPVLERQDVYFAALRAQASWPDTDGDHGSRGAGFASPAPSAEGTACRRREKTIRAEKSPSAGNPPEMNRLLARRW